MLTATVASNSYEVKYHETRIKSKNKTISSISVSFIANNPVNNSHAAHVLLSRLAVS